MEDGVTTVVFIRPNRTLHILTFGPQGVSGSVRRPKRKRPSLSRRAPSARVKRSKTKCIKKTAAKEPQLALPANIAQLSRPQRQVVYLQVLKYTNRPMTPTEVTRYISKHTGQDIAFVGQDMTPMRLHANIYQPRRGVYVYVEVDGE